MPFNKITHFHLFHENFTFSPHSPTMYEFKINNQSTYTFICIQWKIDVWYSIKGNTAMLKRTEFSLVRVVRHPHIWKHTGRQALSHSCNASSSIPQGKLKLTLTPCQVRATFYIHVQCSKLAKEKQWIIQWINHK